MSAWKNFYEGREGHSYLEYVKVRYRPYIKAIYDRIRCDDLVMELGAGTGTITAALAPIKEVDFVATDIDPVMVDIARKRLAPLDVPVWARDAINGLHTAKAEVVHSHGMLEHFDDDTIRKVIDNYRHARVQVHYVPGLYEAPTFGDERLLPVQAWWDICKPDQIITFNDGLDYALVFER
jgi:SAM-dependent methyltransferase